MAAEFQYLNYYTKYSCSGAFELANPHNTACFATAFGKIKGIKGSFSETYKILIYKASNRKVLTGGRSNKCFLNKQQLKNHINQLKSLMDLRIVGLSEENDHFELTVKVTGERIYHLYFLNWARYTYEYPFNVILLDAYKLRKKLITESISNLYNIAAACYNGYSYNTGHAICKGGKLYKIAELKKRLETLAKNGESQVNSIIESSSNSAKVKACPANNKYNNIEYWQSEEEYQKRERYYLNAYELLKSDTKKKKVPVKKAKKIVEK